LSNEKKALFRFLTLYMGSSMMLMLIISTLFFQNQRQHMITQQRVAMVQFLFGADAKPPQQFKRFVITKDEKQFTTQWQSDDTYSYYFQNNLKTGEQYVIAGMAEHRFGATCFLEAMALFGVAMIFFAIMGYFLSKQFLRPFKREIETMERFIKDTTHELNTPITSLDLSLQRLEKTKMFTEGTSKRMRAAIKQILHTYSAIRASAFKDIGVKQVVRLNFERVINEAEAFFFELLQAKNQLLVIESETTWVEMDPHDAKMLVTNLLSNAIKYSPPNTTICVNLNNYQLEVSDQGIGIDHTKLALIFERFKRATEYAGGFGIGLSIVSDVCQFYDFDVDVATTQDGTTFTIKLKK
jgi:two-component system OmpR family sensor kinase